MHDPDKKPYSKPEIVHEADLETRAGSPLLGGDPNPGSILDVDGTGE